MEKEPIFKKATFNKILKDMQDDRKPKAIIRRQIMQIELNALLDKYNFN